MIFRFAVDRGFRADNPARDIKPLKTGEGHKPWPKEAIRKFLNSAPRDMCDALMLALYTGQRKGDVVRMTWASYDGQGIAVVQEKTKEALWIPVHPELRKRLDEMKRKSPIILTRANGKPMTKKALTASFRRALVKAGLDGHTFHGLRYTATERLLEAGCSEAEAQAITGHRSSAMLRKYGKGADQKRLAEVAIHKLTLGETKTSGS